MGRDPLGLHQTGGRFGTNLGWLRTMGVITERGPITTHRRPGPLMATLLDTALLTRYAELDALIERACAACRAKDHAQAVLLSYAVTQKLTSLNRALLAAGIMPERFSA